MKKRNEKRPVLAEGTKAAATGLPVGRKENQGSFTVEAAFVVPFVTVLLVFMAYAAMYLRDVTVAEAILKQETNRGIAFAVSDVYPGTDAVFYERYLGVDFWKQIFQKQEKAVEQILAENLRKRLENAFWVAEYREIQVSFQKNYLRMQIQLNAGSNVIQKIPLIQGSFFEREIADGIAANDIPEWSRIVTTVLRTGERIKGVNEVIDKINLFFSWLGK